MFIKVLLGAAKRFGQLETGKLEAVLEQSDTGYKQQSELRLPGTNGASPREILLTGRAEFEQHSIPQRPDFIEAVINRFTERVALFDGGLRVLSNRIAG